MPKLEFNVAGPCLPGKHYMLDPLRGIEDELMNLVDGEKYFLIHASRQSGKTTLLKALVRKINAEGKYYALYCTLEVVHLMVEPEKGIPAIVYTIKASIEDSGLPKGFAVNANYSDIANVIKSSFVAYCSSLNKPLVVFFDEADCLSNGTLITFLRQLRAGYVNRGDAPFVHSIALVGMRNLRDYTAHIRPESATLGTMSPFNIITESLNLKNFTKAEVYELYAQHTAETGQVFEAQTVDYIFEQTQGQPWLVNAIAREVVEKILRKDFSTPVTCAHAMQAIEDITRDRRTHIDSIMDRLKDPRVRNIILPLLLGEAIKDRSSDDYLFARDLGIVRENDGNIEPANPIYAEMIIRTLNYDAQESMKGELRDCTIPRYLKDGKFDMDFLIRDFQEYWRENSEIWTKRYKENYYEYDEAAGQLVLQAFLQRVINGGGQVLREKPLGTKRVDLCVVYDGKKFPIELKILQNEKSRSESLEQTLAYMDIVGSDNGWLVVFDRSTDKNWDEKIYIKKETIKGKKITVAGC